MAEFLVPIIISLLLVVLYENDILVCGVLSGYNNAEFLSVSMMEILTIGAIPLTLRMFKFKKIVSSLTSDEAMSSHNLLVWGSIRMILLCVPLMINTLLYYLYMNTTFGYMGIILLICLPFVYPSMGRCINETTKADTQE